jgi:hypothetical protein
MGIHGHVICSSLVRPILRRYTGVLSLYKKGAAFLPALLKRRFSIYISEERIVIYALRVRLGPLTKVD